MASDGIFALFLLQHLCLSDACRGEYDGFCIIDLTFPHDFLDL